MLGGPNEVIWDHKQKEEAKKCETWEGFEGATATYANSIFQYLLYMKVPISESVSRKSKLRHHLCLLFHRGITLEGSNSEVGIVETRHGQNWLRKFLRKVRNWYVVSRYIKVCGISLPQRIWSCCIVYTADQVALCLGHIFVSKVLL